MELKARNIQHARNLYDRAVTLLPRVDQFWYKYVYLEELLENIPGARQVFERWMAWEPDDKAWQAYIKMEERYKEWDRASKIYERWVAVRPEPRVWVKWAKFEEERGQYDRARDVYDTALKFFGDEEEEVDKAQAVFAAFAKMETRLKEFERARVIYKVCPLRELIVLNTKAYHSSPCLDYRAPNPAPYTPPTRNSKNSTEHGLASSRLSGGSEEYNMKTKSRTTPLTMIAGSTTHDWRRMPCEHCGRKGGQKRRSKRQWGAYGRSTSEQSQIFLLVTRSGIGGATSSFGCTMPCSRKARRRYVQP